MTSRKWAGLVFPVTLVVGVPSLARATAPPDGFVLLETITVPTDGSSVASTHILQAGVTYKIRALGLFSIGGAGYGYGDAEYAFDGLNGAGNVSDTNIPPEVDLGIAINDTVNDIPKFPSWGSFNPSHLYTIDFVGLGAPLSLNYHDSLYPDNAFPATVEIFAPAGATPPGFVLLETITVPTDGSSVASTHILQVGTTYKVRALGLWVVGGAGYGYADAEYAFDALNGAGNVSDTNIPPEVDLGIAINDTVNDIPKFPSWGSFNPSHVYTIDFVGLGAPISLNYHDSLYPDNGFAATVEIYAPAETAPVAAVPTLTTWAQIILFGLLVASALWALRR